MRLKNEHPVSRTALKVFLFFLIIAAPAAFGAVYAWGHFLIASLAFGLLAFMPHVLSRIWQLPRFFKGAVLLVFAWLLLQTLFIADSRYVAGQELLKWLSVAVIFLMVQEVSKSGMVQCLWLVAFVGLGESFYGLIEVLSGHEKVLWLEKGPHTGFVTGSYFNRNHLAGFLEMALGIQIGFLCQAFYGERLKRILWTSAILFLTLIAFIKTGSRSGMISFAGSLFLCSLFLMRRSGKVPFGFFFYIFVTGVILLQMGWHTLAPRFLQFAEQAETWDGRLIAWKDTLQMIASRFWTGVGLGNFEWSFPQYQSSQLFLGWNHAHQDYLELASEMGVPAFSLWLAGFIGLWLFCVKKLSDLSTELFPLMWGCLVGITALSFHGTTDFNFAVPANVIIYFLLWAFFLRSIRLSRFIEQKDMNDRIPEAAA